jgi:hypothetical protein
MMVVVDHLLMLKLWDDDYGHGTSCSHELELTSPPHPRSVRSRAAGSVTRPPTVASAVRARAARGATPRARARVPRPSTPTRGPTTRTTPRPSGRPSPPGTCTPCSRYMPSLGVAHPVRDLAPQTRTSSTFTWCCVYLTDMSWRCGAQANEALTGRKFVYDGDPQSFGDYSSKAPAAVTGPVTTSSHERDLAGTAGRKRSSLLPPPHQRSPEVMAVPPPTPPLALETLAPAVAMLMVHGACLAQASSSSSANPAPVAVQSCASLESSVAMGEVTEVGLDPLGAFQFDTTDLLGALQF